MLGAHVPGAGRFGFVLGKGEDVLRWLGEAVEWIYAGSSRM